MNIILVVEMFYFSVSWSVHYFPTTCLVQYPGRLPEFDRWLQYWWSLQHDPEGGNKSVIGQIQLEGGKGQAALMELLVVML